VSSVPLGGGYMAAPYAVLFRSRRVSADGPACGPYVDPPRGGVGLTTSTAQPRSVGARTGPHPKTHHSRLNQDVAAGDFEAAYIERFRSRLRRAWRLITSQFPHQGKDKVGVGAIVVLF
jgi:hypothetical protein